MKKILLLSGLLLAATAPGQAQFLNKLKQKAQEAIKKNTSGEQEENQEQATTRESDMPAPATNVSGTQSPASAGIQQYGSALFKLESGESFCYNEHSLKVTNGTSAVKVITKKNREFYLYENDQKTGPFKTAPVNQLDGWPHKEDSDRSEEKKTDWQPYVRAGVLTVDGKNQGNYMALASFYHNKEKKKFYGVAMNLENNNMTTSLISDKGKRKLPMTGGELIIAENDEFAAAKVTATQYNAKTDEEKFKYVANDDFYLICTDGRTLGPFQEVQAQESYLDDKGRFIQISRSRHAVFINGKEVIRYSENFNGDGKLFIGSETSCAWFERGELSFTDGTRIAGAIMPTISRIGDKTAVHWIAIQNQQVYACKKDL